MPIAYFRDAFAQNWTISPYGRLHTVAREMRPGAPAIATQAATWEVANLDRLSWR